jgi:hypothetical protein
MNFKDFKKQQASLKDSVAKLAQKPANNYADERFWNLTKDSAGNANATVRFLPQQDPAKAPVVLTFRHAFQKEGRWFIEPCPHTIGEKCPVCEYSSANWESNEDEARMHWRNKGYIGNILIVDDEANPENNGKVFMYKFGKKLYDMVMEAVAPEDADEEGTNVFDFDEGVNFKLKLVQKAGYNNYDKSKFVAKATAIPEKTQEAVYDGLFDLDEFFEAKLFKTYDELVAKLAGSNTASAVPSIQDEIAKNTKAVAEKKAKEDAPVEDADEDEDEDEEEIDFDALLEDDDE